MIDLTPEQSAYLDLLDRVQALEDATRALAKDNMGLRRRVMELEIRERTRQTVRTDQPTGIFDRRLTGNPDRVRNKQ